MIKEIVKDENILRQKSEPFEFGVDDNLIQDLLDTANKHLSDCVGLAAPQIGVHKRAVVVLTNVGFTPMINPQIFWKDLKSKYSTTEMCLSVDGEHSTTRFRKIKVNYQTATGVKKSQMFTGYTAQIIQHEVDHLNGKLI